MRYIVEAPDGTRHIIEGPDTAAPVIAQINPAPAAAPGSEPLPPPSDYMSDIVGSIGKGLLTGGPFGALIAAGGEGVKGMGKIMDRGAYKAGEKVTDLLAPHVPAEVAGGAGYAANVGMQAIPTLIGALAGKATLEPPLKSAGRNVMHGALKPLQKDILSGDADRAINTLLNEGVNVTEGGAAKLQGIATDLNNQVKNVLNASQAVVTRAKPQDEVMDLLLKNADTASPSSGEKAIMSAWDDFVANHPAVMPVKEAQRIKQATYRDLEKAYLTESTSARDDALKAIARGLKKAIEEVAPEVKPLNARASDVLNALRQVDRRAGISANKNILGLAPAGMNPAAMVAMLADRNSWITSMLARILYSGGGPIGTGVGGAAGAASGLLPPQKQSGLLGGY